MSKWFAICSLLLALASTALAQATDASADCDHLPPTDLRRICESGSLAVARYRGERPPFFTERDGRWVGFDVDLARDIARRLGVDYEERLADSFDQVVDLVASGAADIGVSKLSITLERTQRVRFTKPYMTVYQTLLINRLSVPKQEDPFDFLNRPSVRIGALEGSSYIGYAESEFSAADIAPFSDFTDMMEEVTSSRLDAAFVDSARANTWRRSNPERLINVRAFIARDRRDSLALAVNWEDTHLLAWLDLYLDSIHGNGRAQTLYSRWFNARGGVAAEQDSE